MLNIFYIAPFQKYGHRPTLPDHQGSSTIGANAFHFSVRNGKRWDHIAQGTQIFETELINTKN